MNLRFTHEEIESARAALLRTALDHFSAVPGVEGVFVAGSLAAGSADAFSDIDLRVVSAQDEHAQLVSRRQKTPAQWPGFLFNEWVPNAEHCVSHFAPFNKIDIFYYSLEALSPSPWYRLPIEIAHDPRGIVAALVERSRDLAFMIDPLDVDYSISKGLAAAHEACRRFSRGEVLYAQTLLDELRQQMMQSDDWLNDRTPELAVWEKYEQRGSPDLLTLLRSSYGECESSAGLHRLSMLVGFYGTQVRALHKKFPLKRLLENDLEALAFLCPAG